MTARRPESAGWPSVLVELWLAREALDPDRFLRVLREGVAAVLFEWVRRQGGKPMEAASLSESIERNKSLFPAAFRDRLPDRHPTILALMASDFKDLDGRPLSGAGQRREAARAFLTGHADRLDDLLRALSELEPKPGAPAPPPAGRWANEC